jgi:uncharacterized membrane protein (DUF485 family)
MSQLAMFDHWRVVGYISPKISFSNHIMDYNPRSNAIVTKGTIIAIPITVITIIVTIISIVVKTIMAV